MNKSSLFYNYYYVKELFIIIFIILILVNFIKRGKKIEKKNYTKIIINSICIISILFLLFFFRTKKINLQGKQSYFISPSNSKITDIKIQNNNYIINTYLSPLNLHYMIAPCNCTVIKIFNNPQKNESENLSIIFKDEFNNIFKLEQIVNKLGYGPWLFRLLYKKRCISFVKVGDKLKQGEKYGLIRFGSNMKYIIPKNFKLLKKKGDLLEIGEKLMIK